MSEDFIEKTFADLDAYYPGSKRKRREPTAPKAIEEPTGWEDEFFEKYLPNGDKVQMYTLGSLAKALGKSTKALRLWMEEGKFPTSPYRLPATVGKNGKEYAGRRLYSKAMVEATVEIFKTRGLLGPERIDWALHRDLVDKVAEAWDNIRAKELQTTAN